MPGAVRPFERLKARLRPPQFDGIARIPKPPGKGVTPAEQWRLPEPTDLIFPKCQGELFRTILDEEGLRFDREGRPRTAYSLRHTYISSALKTFTSQLAGTDPANGRDQQVPCCRPHFHDPIILENRVDFRPCGSFVLSRIDPQLAYIRIADRRIEGVPIFDGSFTTADGVSGRLGALGSDADLAETLPIDVARGTGGADILAAARRSRHKAAILVTGGGRPGLFLNNASAFDNPAGPPILQVSSVESAWLKEQAQQVGATVLAYATRIPTRAFNVTAKITGRDRTLAPLVFMAPRSGWWQCVSEQGSRLVCWLEIMRALAAARPLRDCHFVAMSGHELGFLGMNAYLENRLDLVKRAKAWVFLGSDIGAPRQPNLIHAADDALERWILTALPSQGPSCGRKRTAQLTSAG